MNEKNTLNQIKFYSVILVIVIIISIIIGIKGNKKEPIKNETTDENKVDMTNVTIDGYTKDSLEKAKTYMDSNTYNEYAETFNKIEDGEISYDENMSLKAEDEEITEEDTKKSKEILQNALDSKKWHYYVDSKGRTTNTIVFDDVETH